MPTGFDDSSKPEVACPACGHPVTVVNPKGDRCRGRAHGKGCENKYVVIKDEQDEEPYVQWEFYVTPERD